jgi:hypothetical protein
MRDSPRLAQRRRNVARWGLRIGAALCLLLSAGCPKTVKSGATYDAWILVRGNDGKVAPQDPATRVGSAAVENVHELSYEGQTLSLVVRKTQYGKATFDIIFPDKTKHLVQVKTGDPKEILPNGQKIGVRIEIVESH